MANSLQVLRRMYDNASRHYTLPDFDTFCNDMQDEKKRKAAYEKLSGAYDLPDYATFTKDVTITPATPAPQQSVQPAAMPRSASVMPVSDNTAKQAGVQHTVKTDSTSTAGQPTKAEGWKPSAMQRRAFQQQMDNANARMQDQSRQFEQRMEGMKKGNKSGAFMGEREFNPQTGQTETRYYTTQGEQVPTQMAQSRKNTEYHTWWENNTEAGRRSKEQRLQREFEASLGSLWQHHDSDKDKNAAELAWAAAEQRYRKESGSKSNEIDAAPMIGDTETSQIGHSMMKNHESSVSRMTNFDLDRLMDDAWDNLGEDGQKSLIDDCLKILHRRNPGTDDLVLYNQAKELARQQSDLRLYQLAVEKNRPGNELEYLGRKIVDANLIFNLSKGISRVQAGSTGDMAALEQANEQYRQDGHKILDVVGTVTGMALDPTMMIAAWCGECIRKGCHVGRRSLSCRARGFGSSHKCRDASVRNLTDGPHCRRCCRRSSQFRNVRGNKGSGKSICSWRPHCRAG